MWRHRNDKQASGISWKLSGIIFKGQNVQEVIPNKKEILTHNAAKSSELDSVVLARE